MPKLYSEDSRLKLIQTAVVANHFRVVFRPPAVSAQHSNDFGHGGIIRYNHTAVPICAQILTRKEAQAPSIAQRSRLASPVARPHGLRIVLDDSQAMSLREPQNRLHIGRMAVEVDRDDRLGPKGDRKSVV